MDTAGAAAAPVGAAAVAGGVVLVSVLAALGTTVGVGVGGWAVALGCGLGLLALLVRALVRAERESLGPADVVTLGRGLLACAVAGLTTESLLGHHVTVVLVMLTVPALALDAVDGVVARRTGTVSAIGGRFDGEVDAFLILVLSVAAVPVVGWWVLAAGLVRYVFGAAGWVLPWMRGSLEFRYWRKVVTASVGIALTVAVADVLPRPLTVAVVLGALALLAESFGRDVWSLWRGRDVRAGSSRWRGARSALTATVVVALLWFTLVAPNQPDRFTLLGSLRLPVEVVVVGAAGLVVPPRWHRLLAVLAGSVLAVVALLKTLDLAAFTVLDRPFNVVTDGSLVPSGVAFVRDSFGPLAAAGSVVAVVLLVAGLLIGSPWAVGQLVGVLTSRRRRGRRVVAALAGVWVVCALTGAHLASATPVALNGLGPYAARKMEAARTAYQDRERFEGALAVDGYWRPATGELSALAGKDVLLVFVESYGRVALEGSESASVRTVLDDGTHRLAALGFTARSGYLTSSTFGGSSWLAHSTLQSGLPVSDQSRYDRLLSADRTTLTSAFSRAGWRTVAVLPSTHGSWPEGRDFYGFDEVYGDSSLGYAGPRFGFSAMPDQYALAAFAKAELGQGRPRPVMAEIELTSSHGPWAPLPTMVDPSVLGDGSIYREVESKAVSAAALWGDRANVPAAYRSSIEYSLTSVLSFVENQASDDLVLVVVGDHQPATIVSGFGGNRDVPISVISRDPKVIDRVSGWGWAPGLRPEQGSAVWPMSAFRDRFLGAFGSGAP
ncbi:hypothetical protein ASG74_09330 [Knoellia sp. Soil729]|nr:hypothetical protein ASG74_09330 [Knoellia sp. Soil729]